MNKDPNTQRRSLIPCLRHSGWTLRNLSALFGVTQSRITQLHDAMRRSEPTKRRNEQAARIQLTIVLLYLSPKTHKRYYTPEEPRMRGGHDLSDICLSSFMGPHKLDLMDALRYVDDRTLL